MTALAVELDRPPGQRPDAAVEPARRFRREYPKRLPGAGAAPDVALRHLQPAA